MRAINKLDNNVMHGIYTSICDRCVAKEYDRQLSEKKYQVSLEDIKISERGKLEHKKILYFKKSGQDICMCGECVHELYEGFFKEKYGQVLQGTDISANEGTENKEEKKSKAKGKK